MHTHPWSPNRSLTFKETRKHQRCSLKYGRIPSNKSIEDPTRRRFEKETVFLSGRLNSANNHCYCRNGGICSDYFVYGSCSSVCWYRDRNLGIGIIRQFFRNKMILSFRKMQEYIMGNKTMNICSFRCTGCPNSGTFE